MEPSVQPHHAPTSLKAIVLVFALVLVGVLGYLVWQENITTDENAGVKVNTTTNNPLHYSNTELGFTVDLPKSWTGYKTKVSANSYNTYTKHIRFYLLCAANEQCGSDLDQNNNYVSEVPGYFPVMTITAFPVKIWENKEPPMFNPSFKELAANDLYKFSNTTEDININGKYYGPPSLKLQSSNASINLILRSFKPIP